MRTSRRVRRDCCALGRGLWRIGPQQGGMCLDQARSRVRSRPEAGGSEWAVAACLDGNGSCSWRRLAGHEQPALYPCSLHPGLQLPEQGRVDHARVAADQTVIHVAGDDERQLGAGFG